MRDGLSVPRRLTAHVAACLSKLLSQLLPHHLMHTCTHVKLVTYMYILADIHIHASPQCMYTCNVSMLTYIFIFTYADIHIHIYVYVNMHSIRKYADLHIHTYVC